MTLLAAEPVVHAGVAYEVKVERRFWPFCDRQPKWRIGFYDALTGTEITAVNDEDAILRHAPLVEARPPPALRPSPRVRYLVRCSADIEPGFISSGFYCSVDGGFRD